MSWILVAEQKPQTADPASPERRVPIEGLAQGKVFSINDQARRFELVAFDPTATTEYPKGRIMARVVNPDGTYGDEVSLDYGEHQGAGVLVWNSESEEDLTRPLEVFERIRLKGTDRCGVLIDLNKSKFPDCDIIVIWEQPLHGEMVTEVHGHEIESLNERLDPQQKFNGGEQTLAQLRQVCLDLRDKNEDKYENRTKEIVKQQIAQALEQQTASVARFNESLRQEALVVQQALAQQFAPDLKQIADACVLSVTAGEGNYELERIGDLLSCYADSIWRMASQVSTDTELAFMAARGTIENVADSAWKSYFLTRFAFVRKQDGKWCVISEKGKRLGCYPSKEKAVRRLRQIEYFKRHGGTVDVESLDNLEDLGAMR